MTSDYVDLQVPAELIKKLDDGTAYRWFETLNEQFLAMGKVDAAVDPKTYILAEEYKKA